jgi:hypothetical protein
MTTQHKALNGGVEFSRGGARRPAPILAEPVMQWSTGLPTEDRKQLYAGWLIEVDQDEALDEAMLAAGYGSIKIRHGGGNVVAHWRIESASVFVLADGVQTMSEMRSTPERYGIAFAWRELPDGRRQSVLRMRVLVRELLAVGYDRPLLISVKSTLTGDLIAALLRQYDVLDAAQAEQARSGKAQRELPFYAFSLPLGPGVEVARGRAQTKEIVPMVAQVPGTIEREYLLAHWIDRAWVAGIEARMDETIAWSVAQSAQVAAGVEEGEGYEGQRGGGFGR